MALGRWSEATKFLDAAIASDPLDPDFHAERGFLYLRVGRFAEAERAFGRALEISPTFAWARYALGIVLVAEQRPDAALKEMQMEPGEGMRLAGRAVGYQALHRTKDSDTALAQLAGEHAADEAFEIAEAYAFRGQKDRAFEWLDRAYAQKDFALYYMKGDPLLKNLEGEPRC